MLSELGDGFIFNTDLSTRAPIVVGFSLRAICGSFPEILMLGTCLTIIQLSSSRPVTAFGQHNFGLNELAVGALEPLLYYSGVS
jgi:hypothetical protein